MAAMPDPLNPHRFLMEDNMRIRWTKPVMLETSDHYSEEMDIKKGTRESFQAGDESDVQIFGTYAKAKDIEFEDGTVAYAVPTDWFTEIK